MKKYNISQIKYDTSDAQGGAEEMVSLPKSLTVYCESEDQIADTISDSTDFLVLSFNIDSVEEI